MPHPWRVILLLSLVTGVAYLVRADVAVAQERMVPAVGITMLEAIKAKQPKEIYLNPGAESDELIARAEALGLEPIVACSIIEIGERP